MEGEEINVNPMMLNGTHLTYNIIRTAFHNISCAF